MSLIDAAVRTCYPIFRSENLDLNLGLYSQSIHLEVGPSPRQTFVGSGAALSDTEFGHYVQELVE